MSGNKSLMVRGRGRWATVFVSLALMAAACGQTDSDADEQAADAAPETVESEETPPSTEAELEAVDDAAPEVEDDTQAGDDESATSEVSRPPGIFEQLALPAGTNTLPSFGGVQFDLPDASRFLVEDDCFLTFEPSSADLGPRLAQLYIGEFGASERQGELNELRTIDQWIELITNELGEPPEETGETRELFGQTLTGFRFDDAPFLGQADAIPELLVCGQIDSPGFIRVFPLGFEEWFVAQTEDSLLVVVSGGPTPEVANDVHELRDQILPTLQRVDPPVPIVRPIADPGAEPTELDLVAPDLEGRSRTLTYPALGGVRFAVDETHDVWHYGDGIAIDPVGAGSNASTGIAALALFTQAADGSELSTVEQVLDTLSLVPELSVQPNGHFVDLFDRQLTGYTVELTSVPEFSVSLPDDALRLLDATRRGALRFFSFTPQRTQMYLAETPAGVLYAAFDVNPYAEVPVTQDAFATLLATAELTGPGLDQPLPEGSILGGAEPPPAPAEIVEDSPPPLFVSFQQPEDGRHQIHNFGIPISADVTGWFLQPNAPGSVVFVGAGISRGPGDRGVVFLAGLQPHIVPQAGGPSVAGDPVDLSDIESFLANPPDNLDVSNVSQTDIGGFDAFRFDVRVAEGATCAQDDPCEYAFETAWNWPATVSINAANEHRIWWIPDHPAGPSMIHATDISSEFIEIATGFVDSIEAVG